ncbi:MAG: cell division protein FtsQ/DivIB [Pseudobutyrivibrio sp.]|nr:cell division protein FtsQ/DivIB [Pseudobutyrivibrio sp.]
MSRRRKKRKNKGIVIAIIEFVLAIVIIGALLAMAAYFFCPLKKVTVEGTDLYTSKEVSDYILDDKYSSNTIYVFVKNKLFPKGDAEFIERFDVQITGMHSVNIVCKEKAILGYMTQDDGKYVYFNYEGKIAEISETYIERGYMKVDGVTCEDPKVGDKLSIGSDQIGYLTSLIKILKKNSLMPNEISYDENNHITLVYDTYNISLGNRSRLEEKIERVMLILPKIEGMQGTLHLENYSSQNTDIVFEKDTEAEQ